MKEKKTHSMVDGSALRRVLLSAVAIVPLVACTGTDVEIRYSDIPVSFDAFGSWTEDAGTRAEASGSASFADGDAMGVTAYWMKDGGGIDKTVPNFMYNQKVTYSSATSGDGTWSYSPVKYWPVSGTVNFYAYCPYAASGDSHISLSENTATGKPALTYTNSAADIDLMAASSEGLSLDGGSTSAPSVPLTFRHILAKVRFTFSYSGSASYEPVVQMVQFGKVPYIGTYRFSDSSWDINDSESSYVKRFTNDVSGVVISEKKQLVDDLTCYLLPGSEIKGEIILAINNIKYSYSVPSDKEVKVEQGKTYTLHFNIDNSGGGNYFITSFLLWEDGGEYSGTLK